MPGPEKKFKAGGVSATIWNNKIRINGNEVDNKTITIERSYQADEVIDGRKNGNKTWKTTSSFRQNDLQKVILVAQESQKYLIMQKQD
jgi:hypothetical protein